MQPVKQTIELISQYWEYYSMRASKTDIEQKISITGIELNKFDTTLCFY